MKIFEKRPLAIILCVMLGVFSFFADCTWQIKLILSTVPIVVIVGIYIFDAALTKEQVEFLKGIGCNLFQGYYFARPMDVKTFEETYM